MYINQLELQTKNKKVDVLEDGVHVKAARKTADLPGCDSNAVVIMTAMKRRKSVKYRSWRKMG